MGVLNEKRCKIKILKIFKKVGKESAEVFENGHF